ncbi:hypothetical protein PPYR_00327 [Photinus pyralis]|uniref:Protein LTV1 homolog n=1 Tax=Photinus pyralis TaxID=7054 RepID=A0A5N4B182_PHOPY|nr:protein LTV1 homolog [Photinus pyralis]XP_031328277.1 protein LTV1 homolog [Photinus pyralis]KAB0803328.1 hypothetical protein PPYR_00298 [Photinus pyralis]KAB0803357.1 hypothetical protein PPYR_00327 [Photinus pyralis]
MPKNKKKFIDRKNAVTFHLVHRSQQDPLAADESAPQHVLIPLHKKTNNKGPTKRKEEQEKYGIFYDDDYNYLQHLRDVNSTAEWVPEQSGTDAKAIAKPKLQLPSSVFASTVEEKVGLLNKAAPHRGPRPDLDPDVVAAMDEDFDYDDPENELEDNFIELANAEVDEDVESDVDSDFDSEALDAVNSLEDREYTFRDEETKSRFTEYSMSSSVMRRNDQLTLLDDKFEQLYATYDDTEIGALDLDEIEGHIPDATDLLLRYADEYRKRKEQENLYKEDGKVIYKPNEESDLENEEELVKICVPEREKWDCESILSTYSNIYNHPKLIKDPKPTKIKVNMRTGIPVDILNSSKLTSKALSQLNEDYNRTHNGPTSVAAKSIISTLSTLSIRPPDETLEEKRERKRLLREYRKERRCEKKINSEAFKDEHKRQIKITINNRNNVQGNKIL